MAASRRPQKPASTGRIYAVIRRIPHGRVTTYGAVGRAARVGARQVGYALHRLPDGTPLPWHRVINAGGGISLRGASAVTQRLRLEREGVRFSARGAVSLMRFGWLLALIVALVRPAAAQQPPAARITVAQFGQLRWLVGFWRGSGGNYPAFFEEYRMTDDSTIAMRSFADSARTRVTGSSTIQLRGGQVQNRGGGSTVYRAAELTATMVRFEAEPPGSGGFVWQHQSPSRWTATLGPAARPTVYQMQRLSP